MNTQQMLYRFQEINDTSAKLLGREYQFIDTETMLHYLNMAQERIFKERYLSNGVNSIIAINNSLNELNKLVKTVPATIHGKSTIYKEAYILKVSNECAFPIKVLASSVNTVLGVTSSSLPCTILDYNKIDRFLTNEYNAPILLRPLYTFNYGGAEIDFSFDSNVYTFDWNDRIFTQTLDTNVAFSSYEFIWDNLINSQIIAEENNLTMYVFDWNSTIKVQVQNINEELFTFNWENTINVQYIPKEDSVFIFIWNNLVNNQELYSLDVFEFIWEDIVNNQIEGYTDNNYLFLWNDLVKTQFLQDNILSTIFEFVWESIVKNQVEDSNLYTTYEFNWDDIIQTVLDEEYLSTEFEFMWESPVKTRTEQLIADMFTFIWNDRVLNQFMYTTGYNYLWKDVVPIQILMESVNTGDVTSE